MNNITNKPLGLGALIALVVGNMVGSGIFLLPASLANLGSTSLLSWGFTVIGAFLIAGVLVKNSQFVPENGGPYAYAKHGFGKFIGFQTAYCQWVGMWVAVAAVAIAMVGYLAAIFPIFSNEIWSCFAAIAAVWIVTIVNMFGVRSMGKLQIVTVILKLIPVILIILFGWIYFHPHYILEDFNASRFNMSYNSFSSAAALTLWAFIGIESATIPYEFISNPRRNIPLATLIGALIAAVIYVLSSTVIMGMIPGSVLAVSKAPFVAAATMIFGSWGKWIMLSGAVISCFGCLNGWMFLQSQVAMAAADDRLFPRLFALRNRAGVPGIGLGITAFLISAVLLLTLHKDMAQQFEIILIMASFASLIPYLYGSAAGVIILRKRAHQLSNAKAQIYSFLAFIASLYAFWAVCGTGGKMIFYGSILLFTSILLYVWGDEN